MLLPKVFNPANEKSGRNVAPQQHGIKHAKHAPNQPTMGLGKFQPNKQTGGNFF